MKSPLTHLLLSCGICAAILGGYGVWYATVANKSAAAAALQNEIDAKTALMSRLATTRATVATVAGDEALVQSYFVPETGVAAFIDGLQTLGRSQGSAVNVLSVSTGGTDAQPVLDFTLSIKGTFDAVMRTVGAIEYAPYAASISNLSIGQNGKNGWYANLEMLVSSTASSTPPTTP